MIRKLVDLIEVLLIQKSIHPSRHPSSAQNLDLISNINNPHKSIPQLIVNTIPTKNRTYPGKELHPNIVVYPMLIQFEIKYVIDQRKEFLIIALVCRNLLIMINRVMHHQQLDIIDHRHRRHWNLYLMHRIIQ